MKRLILPLILGACSTSSAPSEIVDSGLSDAADLSPSDGGAEQTSEDDAGAEGQDSSSACRNTPCAGAWAETSAEGTTPWGRFVAQRAAVSYVAGFTNYTTVTVRGTLEGEDAELVVNIAPSSGDLLYAAEPGTYEDVDAADGVWATFGRPTSDGQCVNEEPAGLKIVITEHQPPTDDFKPGDAAVLKGTLTAQGSGWDLQIPASSRSARSLNPGTWA
jgi:hypothetical protein